MRSLRCLLGIHDYQATKCLGCGAGWNACRRCDTPKSDADAEARQSHIDAHGDSQ